MNKFQKINMLVNLELIAILCVVFISFAIAILPFIFIDNSVLELLAFIIILIPLSLGLGFMTKKFFDSEFKKLEYKKAVSRINVKINNNIKIRHIESNETKIYYINHYHLSTISFLLLNDMTEK